MNDIWKGKIIRLRGLQMEDADTLATLPPNSEADAFVDQIYLPLNRTLDHERDYVMGVMSMSRSSGSDDCKLAIETLNDAQLVGTVGVHSTNRRFRRGEIDVAIAPEQEWGKGYASEAILILLNYFFNELDYQRIGLGVLEPNERAYKLYDRLGFVEEGRLRRHYFYHGQYHAEIKMSILKEEFLAQHKAFTDFLYKAH